MNHLVLWIVAAIVATAAIGVVTMGLGTPTAFALLHAPAMLAAMLLARALVLVLRERSFALQWRARPVLAGKAGLWVPALFLLAWTALREFGVLDVNACVQAMNSTTARIPQPWTDRVNEPLLDDQRIRVFAPANAFGRAIDAELVDRWIYGFRAVHAEITIDGDAPFSPWPLDKSTALQCVARGVVQLHPASSSATGPVRCSSFEVRVEGTFSTRGFASHRKHCEWIGKYVGAAIRTQIEELLRREPQ